MTVPWLAAPGMLARAAVASGPWARWPRSRGSVGVRRRSRPWARPWTGSPLAGLQSCWWRARPGSARLACSRRSWRTRGAAACRWPRAGPRNWSGPGRSACWPPRSGAETACRSLLARDLDPSLESAVRVCLGRALLSAGRARDSLCELERACQSPPLTSAERAEAQAWASFARLRLLDLDGTAAAAGEARSAAVSARDHAATSIAMASLAVVSENRGHLREALQDRRRCRATG